MVKKFIYTKTFKYDKSHDERIINKIIFDTCIDLNMKHGIDFESPVTLHYAINEVEKYLSGKLTKAYLKANTQIEAHYSQQHENWHEYYQIKGDLLGGYFLLQAAKIKDGIVTLICGN